MVHWVRCNWLTVLALCSLCAEAEKRLSDSHLTGMAKLRCTLLKRPADLPEDDGDGRKKVALNALGEKTADVASFLDPLVESNGEEKTECGAVVVAIDKGKAKAKVPKRKLRSSEPPNTGPGRVATRGDKKKMKIKILLALKAWGALTVSSINRYYLICSVLCSPSVLSLPQFLPEECMAICKDDCLYQYVVSLCIRSCTCTGTEQSFR